jgi:Ca2+-binding EF-hand superfamily protein
MVESFNELGMEIEWTQQIFNDAFDELDTNKNGTIEKDEVYNFFKELAKDDDVREEEKKKR